jgi:hypothetical protein
MRGPFPSYFLEMNMGWWSLGKHGGIGGLMDDPRTENADIDLIMGDGPADVLGNFIDDLRRGGIAVPSKDALALAVTTDIYDSLPDAIRKEAHGLRVELFKEWQDITSEGPEGSRDPHPQELQGCFDFVMHDGYDKQDV